MPDADGHSLLVEHAVTPDGVVHDALVTVSGDRVVACEPYAPSAGARPGRVAGWVLPGFVDIHVHGGGGFDYATEDPDAALRARHFHAAHGTTTSFASLVTAPVGVLCRQIGMLADLVMDGHFAGIHLEGPFLSTQQCGAHDPALLRPPDAATIDLLLTAGRGAVAMVTIAPELPGATAAIGQLTDAGVRVAMGHTDADESTVARGLEAGASVATHLFNAMPGIHHRNPGPIPLLLTDPRVAVELIADGFHVHRDVLRLASTAAGPERTILITDAMAAGGMPDGEFALGGLQVAVRDGMARLVRPDGAAGAIAGSTLTMARAFELMVGVVGQVASVAAMASTNAATKLGLNDVGRIEPGRRADRCVVDFAGVLQRVMQSGQWLEPPP